MLRATSCLLQKEYCDLQLKRRPGIFMQVIILFLFNEGLSRKLILKKVIRKLLLNL